MPDFALIESWDFGQKHPAVSWSQFLPNRLGGTYSRSGWGIGSSSTKPYPLSLHCAPSCSRAVTTLRVCCDPAGAGTQGHGIRQTAVDVLNKHLRQLYGPQMGARYTQNANRPKSGSGRSSKSAGI
jgi:hypothetical protein